MGFAGSSLGKGTKGDETRRSREAAPAALPPANSEFRIKNEELVLASGQFLIRNSKFLIHPGGEVAVCPA